MVTLAEHRVLGNDVFAVWPQNRHLPSGVRAAIEALAARMPALLAADAASPERVPAGDGRPGMSDG